MADFTKGPITVEASQSWPFEISLKYGDKTIMSAKRFGHTSLMKTIDDLNNGKGFEGEERDMVIRENSEQMFNFLLWSSAPELHFVVENLINGVETGLIKVETPADEMWSNIIHRAKAALKKAKGES